ncbi:GerAB/ArcD/ProY family transporter [Cohnella caldifontis]|uniref:GerAB/ArcD/ProY family transporter n=1 Tax=Cohnella caldifontis TaxID=3027471 RepID=UPI0023EC1921|nr:endospore germination permease [Cohnella sp. YIM B05605]
MIRISRFQLFSMLILFQLGTTILFGFASGAGRDAWIASLLSALLGAAIIAGYLALFRMTGGLTLVEWFPALFGRWPGTIAAWLYPLLFLYDAGRIVADIRFLFPITILSGTPDWVIAGSFLIVVVYGLYAGVEVVGRVAGVLFPVVMVFFFLEIVLLVASGSLDAHHLSPVMAEGWGRVWNTVWPLGITQTFGESISFAMIWTYIARKNGLAGTTLAATLAAGAIIALTDVLGINGLGEGVFRQMTLPSLALLKLPSLADFLENLDALGVIYLVVNAFMKLSLHLLSVVLCVRRLTGAKSDRWIIPAAAAAAFFMGMTMADSFTDHLEAGFRNLPLQIWVPLFLVLPAAALAVAGIRKLGNAKGENPS